METAAEHGPLVVVKRNGRRWRAEVAGHSEKLSAASLIWLNHRVTRLLGPGWVHYEFHTGDEQLDRLAGEVRDARRAAQAAARHAQGLTEKAVAVAAQHAELSCRDISVLVALSHQRVQQLLTGRAS